MNSNNISSGHLENVTKIGEGVYGVAYKATLNRTDGTIAVVVKKGKETEGKKDLKHEAKLLKKLAGNANVVQVIGTFDVKQYSLGDPKLVLEYCDLGNLIDWRGKQKKIDTNNKAEMLAKYVDIMKQVFTGLEFIHANNIVHCDIKPDNLLLKGDSNKPSVKIADFGGAQLLKSFMTRSAAFTPTYSAPESVGQSRFGKPHDIWSTGCVAYYVLYKKVLFNGGIFDPLKSKFSNSPQAQNLSTYSSKHYASLVLPCLQFDPSHRPSASRMKEVCDQPLSVGSIEVSVEHNKCSHSCAVM